jgi:hypothetical protein
MEFFMIFPFLEPFSVLDGTKKKAAAEPSIHRRTWFFMVSGEYG